jgi:hypothetical protein
LLPGPAISGAENDRLSGSNHKFEFRAVAKGFELKIYAAGFFKSRETLPELPNG